MPDKTLPIVRVEGVSLAYGKTRALDDVNVEIPSGIMVGLIGPDGVGKSTLLSLVTGALALQQGEIHVMGGSMRSASHRRDVGPRIAFMPQGLGKNLYHTLSVDENLQFFGRLFGHSPREIKRRSDDLKRSTGLGPFGDRPAGKLSGGMKQKLGLCCALIHDPDLLVLDEPTTGVDPLSRRQFWDLINEIRQTMPGMSVIVATAYMEEAARFDWLIAMDAGRILATGSTEDLLAQTGTPNLDAAFIALLPPEKQAHHEPVKIIPAALNSDDGYAIEANHLTKKFGSFTAVDNVSFQIPRGEIFGFLGSNGCGKTTTMKMLTGLLPVTEGTAKLFGREVDPHDLETRRHVGYMSQLFSLYTELTVRQNLELHARLFHMPEKDIPARVEEMAREFDLLEIMDVMPSALSLGIRQRLSLAVAMIHSPDILILDEPTSGVDPVARDGLWNNIISLSRNNKVTIFISTHFMNEAELCDRISFMHAGKVLVSDTPSEIIRQSGADDMENAFIAYLEKASAEEDARSNAEKSSADSAIALQETNQSHDTVSTRTHVKPGGFSFGRMLSYAQREQLELRRDPIRATLALVGSLILMFVIGYGVSMDVEDLSFAVLDYDRSTVSQNYTLEISGSRYFDEHSPISSYDEMDRRMRNGELSLAIEIPPGFGRKVAAGRAVEVGAWIDGAMPQRAETVRGYVQGMHQHWLTQKQKELLRSGQTVSPFNIETRYRYNPDVKSMMAMVPAVIPMLLMLIPAMLSTLSVAREKELGSITNLYVTPVTRTEFLLGKQLPYLILAMINFVLLTAAAVFVFGVPIKGSLLTLTFGAMLYVVYSTGFGLFVSSFTKSQIAAIFTTSVLSILPVVSFSGLINPVSSLEGAGAFIGKYYPATHFITISRGTFAKALGFQDLQYSFGMLAVSLPVILALSLIMLKKQAKA